MVLNIEWCLRTKNGIEIVEPNQNMSFSYLKMAEESLEELKRLESKIWIASASYYTMYYSLYALMIKIGIKCEIHSCSLLFMRTFLKRFYSTKDIEIINEAFRIRNDMQYYPDRGVLESSVQKIKNYAPDFYANTIAAISKIKEADIKLIQEELRKKGRA